MAPDEFPAVEGTKLPLETVVRRVLATLKRFREGASVSDLVEYVGASRQAIRHALQVISAAMTEMPCPQGYSLSLDWTPRGSIAGAKLEPPQGIGAPSAGPASYAMDRADAEAVLRVMATYLANPRALPQDQGDALYLIDRFPALLSPPATGTGVVPSPSLLILAGEIRRHGVLGRLPSSVTTPAATVTFKTDVTLANFPGVQPA